MMIAESIPVRLIDPSEKHLMPERANSSDAGIDLKAAVDITLGAGEWRAVPTGITLAIPSGYAGFVHPRSGLAAKYGITVLNTPGTIDADYRGEVKVILHNVSSDAFRVRTGDRIAQLIIQRVELPEFTPTEELDDTARGTGGFGSTGISATYTPPKYVTRFAEHIRKALGEATTWPVGHTVEDGRHIIGITVQEGPSMGKSFRVEVYEDIGTLGKPATGWRLTIGGEARDEGVVKSRPAQRAVEGAAECILDHLRLWQSRTSGHSESMEHNPSHSDAPALSAGRILCDLRKWITDAAEFFGMAEHVEIVTSRNAMMATGPRGDVAVAAVVNNGIDKAVMLTQQDRLAQSIHKNRHLSVPLEGWPTGPGADVIRHAIDRWVTFVAETWACQSRADGDEEVVAIDQFKTADPGMASFVMEHLRWCRIFARHQPPVAGWSGAELFWRDPASGAMIFTAHRDGRRMVITAEVNHHERTADLELWIDDQMLLNLTGLRIDSSAEMADLADSYEKVMRQELDELGTEQVLLEDKEN